MMAEEVWGSALMYKKTREKQGHPGFSAACVSRSPFPGHVLPPFGVFVEGPVDERVDGILLEGAAADLLPGFHPGEDLEALVNGGHRVDVEFLFLDRLD